MPTKTITWPDGSTAVLTYGGQGSGPITVRSDPNNHYEARSAQVVVKTTDGSNIQRTITIHQAAKVRIDISNAVVTAANQTYSGTAKTPTPTVTLNGETVPSSGYDVAYSNNTNAGTATITVTGKGDYTGTATGTFTIAKAAPTYTAPVALTPTYNGSSQNLVSAGVSSHGTFTYSISQSGTYSSTIPKGTNAGSYTVWWKFTGDSNHTNISATQVSGVIIAKAAPTYTAPTKKTGLTYNGSAQVLLNAGSTSHGTIYYSSDNSTWSTSIPTQINANTSGYTVYWKLTGDSNHSDIASTAITGITIAKASRTLSFADAYAVVAPSGTVTKIATPSAGSGDGAITYTISSTTYATINSSTGVVTAKTSEGSAIVTATIAAGTNYLSATASYNLYVFATTHNFAYTGSVQNIALPPGSYKLQCWGAQGGSNAADSTYGITAQAGGKGGYAEGVLTIAAQTTLYAFVGGQGGSSGNGGWNCGGGSTGSSSYTSGSTIYTSRFGCGGGATDFALVTSSMTYSSRRNNRSAASLLSRIIVAGGGSGGAMDCWREPATVTEWQEVGTLPAGTSGDTGTFNGHTYTYEQYVSGGYQYVRYTFDAGEDIFASGDVLRITLNSSFGLLHVVWSGSSTYMLQNARTTPAEFNYITCPASTDRFRIIIRNSTYYTGSVKIEKQVTIQTTVDTKHATIGWYGGGVNGGGGQKGTQNTAGYSADFGLGANQTYTNRGSVSGAGGAGWYGGGVSSANASNQVSVSGGGSGFVNIAANAQYRPTGYTGIELDSGSTTDGSSSFPSTGGGTETGHAGNGYAKITRLS